MNGLDIDLALMKKYDTPGPRYTSYPTAPHFAETFGASQFQDEIIRTNTSSRRGLSLYFHLPFCDTLCYFCGCNMIVTHNSSRISQYLDYLEQEVRQVKEMLHPDRKVEQLHWGGGTPTYLSPTQINRLGGFIRQQFDFSEDAEISVEIDPRGLERDHLVALQQAGFTRASLGVQDFDPTVQAAVNREQPYEMTKWVVDELRELGFNSINLDLMYGLPFQTEATFAKTLEQILTLEPERLAVFNYAHVPWLKKHQRLIPSEMLPSPESKLQILKHTIETLLEADYVYIGMDHFARPDDELAVAQRTGTLYRNFQGYSTRASCDLYAFGITGISMLEEVYAQNVKEINEYYHILEERGLPATRGYRLSDDDRLRRYVITRLMCDMKLEKSLIATTFDIDFDDYFRQELEALSGLQTDGLLKVSSSRIEVTPMGRLLIRNIAMVFDAYFSPQQAQKMFSRTI